MIVGLAKALTVAFYSLFAPSKPKPPLVLPLSAVMSADPVVLKGRGSEPDRPVSHPPCVIRFESWFKNDDGTICLRGHASRVGQETKWMNALVEPADLNRVDEYMRAVGIQACLSYPPFPYPDYLIDERSLRPDSPLPEGWSFYDYVAGQPAPSP